MSGSVLCNYGCCVDDLSILKACKGMLAFIAILRADCIAKFSRVLPKAKSETKITCEVETRKVLSLPLFYTDCVSVYVDYVHFVF